jgi:hypothetical protein
MRGRGRPKPLLVLVNGAVPGLGKSTLAKGLADRLRHSGFDVELFEEHEILVRPEFEALVGEWRSTDRVSFATLIASTNAYLDSCRRRAAGACVLDSLLPFLPSLLAWGCSDSEIDAFFRQLDLDLDGFEVLHIQLEGDVKRALQRATEREDDEWLKRFVTKVGGYEEQRGSAHDFESVVAYLTTATKRSNELLSRAPWRVWFVDADPEKSVVFDEVAMRLETCAWMQEHP